MEAFLKEHGLKIALAITAPAVAFLLKLGRDFVVDKSREAAGLRIVAVYVRLAVEEWDHVDLRPDASDPRKPRRILNLCAYVRKILASPPDGGQEGFTPFVPFSPHDNLTVAEVRDFLGFLDSRTIEKVVKFIQAEAITHALAADFRSEFVRQRFSQRRKAELLLMFNRKVVEAYDTGQAARMALEPLCPQPIWWLPFGYRIWRSGVWVSRLVARAWHCMARQRDQ